MKISVIGTGYVGLVSGACFADVGNSVLCLDVNDAKIAMLNSGGIPIHEPGLDALVARNAAAGRIKFSTSYDEAVEHAEVIFLAVGTPPDEDGSADLTHILSAARSIGQRITKRMVIVDSRRCRSVPAKRVEAEPEEEVDKRGVNVEFAVVTNPEFLKEGAAVEDFMRPDRIVVGADDERRDPDARAVHAVQPQPRKLVVMDVRSAELTKYAANAMLATRISFMNELANLAEGSVPTSSSAPRHRLDRESNPSSCTPAWVTAALAFPKDVKALIKTASENDQALHFWKLTEKVNHAQKNVLFKKLNRFFKGDLRGKKIALWGLSFKANTDDMREAASLTLIRSLVAAGAQIVAYDPVVSTEAMRVLTLEHGADKGAELITIAASADEATEGVDALVLVTEWKELARPTNQ